MPLEIAAHGIQVRRSGFEIHADRVIISAGRISLLVGSNGSGKTTFLDAFTGRRPMTEGRMLLASREVTRDWLRRETAYVSQERPWLDELSIRDVVAVAALMYPAFDRDLAERALSGCGLLKHRRVGTCSAGEQRMIEHVVACCSGSAIVALDETFAFLDESRAALLAKTATEASIRSLVLIAVQDTAQQSLFADADRYLVVRDGSTARVLKDD